MTDLSPYFRVRIVMEQIGSVAGTLEPQSCPWYALMQALEELDELATELDPDTQRKGTGT